MQGYKVTKPPLVPFIGHLLYVRYCVSRLFTCITFLIFIQPSRENVIISGFMENVMNLNEISMPNFTQIVKSKDWLLNQVLVDSKIRIYQ